jgi:hypothetical protein
MVNIFSISFEMVNVLVVNVPLTALICCCFPSHNGPDVGERAWPHWQSEERRIMSKQNASPVF